MDGRHSPWHLCNVPSHGNVWQDLNGKWFSTVTHVWLRVSHSVWTIVCRSVTSYICGSHLSNCSYILNQGYLQLLVDGLASVHHFNTPKEMILHLCVSLKLFLWSNSNTDHSVSVNWNAAWSKIIQCTLKTAYINVGYETTNKPKSIWNVPSQLLSSIC